MNEQAPQREYPLRELFDGLSWFVREGCPWRMMPKDLLPRLWVVERSFAWVARFRRLARDYERLPTTLAGHHWLIFAMLMLTNLFVKNK